MKFVPPDLRVGEQVFLLARRSEQNLARTNIWIVVAVEATMVVFNTGTSIFQVSARKLRRPLDTVDLEEPPDSCERYGFLKRAKQMPGSFFTDTPCMSAILDR